MAPTSNPRQREPLFDVHPRTGISFEVFYSDRTLETFGRCGSGWFWWPRQRGFSPDGLREWPISYELRSISARLGDRFGDQRHRRLEFANQVRWIMRYIGGEGGIRTPDRLAPMPHFECGAFDHSATSPSH